MARIHAEMVVGTFGGPGRRGRPGRGGDTPLLLESMKTEIPVLVEEAGTVSRVVVAEGDGVQEGGLLAVVE